MHAHPKPSPSRYLELEALQEGVRWSSVERHTIVVLAAQFLATRQDQSGYSYFHEGVAVHLGEPLFLALEGVFQARLTSKQSIFRRLAWLRDALDKLDRAVAQEPGLTTYFRGLTLAELPALLRKGDAATADLDWVLRHQSDFPTAITSSLRGRPSAVVPFLLIRDNLIQRVYHQRTGYWQPDGEGMEPVSPAE